MPPQLATPRRYGGEVHEGAAPRHATADLVRFSLGLHSIRIIFSLINYPREPSPELISTDRTPVFGLFSLSRLSGQLLLQLALRLDRASRSSCFARYHRKLASLLKFVEQLSKRCNSV